MRLLTRPFRSAATQSARVAPFERQIFQSRRVRHTPSHLHAPCRTRTANSCEREIPLAPVKIYLSPLGNFFTSHKRDYRERRICAKFSHLQEIRTRRSSGSASSSGRPHRPCTKILVPAILSYVRALLFQIYANCSATWSSLFHNSTDERGTNAGAYTHTNAHTYILVRNF